MGHLLSVFYILCFAVGVGFAYAYVIWLNLFLISSITSMPTSRDIPGEIKVAGLICGFITISFSIILSNMVPADLAVIVLGATIRVKIFLVTVSMIGGCLGVFSFLLGLTVFDPFAAVPE
jgi:hypothetical protein